MVIEFCGWTGSTEIAQSLNLDLFQNVAPPSPTLQASMAPLPPHQRWGPPTDGLPAQDFLTDDLQRLVSPIGLLNDVIMNGCATLLKLHTPPPRLRTLLFDCHEIHRLQEGASEQWLWECFLRIEGQVRTRLSQSLCLLTREQRSLLSSRILHQLTPIRG